MLNPFRQPQLIKAEVFMSMPVKFRRKSRTAWPGSPDVRVFAAKAQRRKEIANINSNADQESLTAEGARVRVNSGYSNFIAPSRLCG